MPTATGDSTSTSVTAARSNPRSASPIRRAGSIATWATGDLKTSPTTLPRLGQAMRWARPSATLTATARSDLLVTGWGDQRLYRNLGAGRFEDVTVRAGLTSSLWSTSAAFADLDGDGDLDLYVANYLEFDAKAPPYCAAPDGRRDYCGPEDFPAQPDRLYRNNGDGTFTDVSRSAGIDRPEGRGLGVLIAELTGDNRPDIYVANDGTPCWLFANRGNLHFEEIGEAAGVARDGQGQVLAGMGVAAGDVNADGVIDLVVTNFLGTVDDRVLARKSDERIYADATSRLGLGALTRGVLGFGVALIDFDGDGHLDLIQANGHVLDRARLGTPLAMRPMILRNGGFQLRRCVEYSRGIGSTGRSWAAAWPPATWTATGGPTWSPARSMHRRRSCRMCRPAAGCFAWKSSIAMGIPRWAPGLS